MELAQQARELGCWAAEEMEAPVAARAPESTLRRLCLGQGADIWAYVLRHVHSQRNVKKIRGNLLWYGHQDSPEARRKLKLEAAVAHLRAEILELDQSLELMERETEAQDMTMEQALQSMQDTQRRALLLRAQAGAMRRQQRGLQGPMQQLQNQLKHLQDIERKAKVDINFGPLTSAALSLEPVVLGDVRTACSLRTQFLQKLLMPRAKGGSIPTPRDDLFGTSYQQWLSSVETLLTNHPPGHILAALEHLAAEREAEIQSLCTVDELQDTEIARVQARGQVFCLCSSAPILSSQAPDQPNSSQALPSMVHLIQEGWQSVAALVTQRGPLLKDHQILTQHLQGLMEEMERRTVGSSERQALVLGLRSSALWAELKALHAMSRELEEAAGQRQLLLQELQAKQQRILHWRQLVAETQEQVRLLIKGNSASKTSLCRSPGEVLALVRQKVVPTSEMVAPQSQELLRCLEEEAQHLPHLLLGTLLRHSPGGLQPLPTVLPSIHQLHPASPRGSSLIVLSHTLGLPAGKAPELLLPKAASLRQDLLFLQDQQSLRCWYLLHMKTSLPPGPSTQELLQIRASQEKEQKENLGRALKCLEHLLKQALKRIPELQGVVGDWWEQPGQAALSGELCQGLSLPQWQLRWIQAQGALQQLCR
ncbi:HAUS augmin-like complex subunit 5 isoform X1 [Physeter macrocephalus]|uniref:HAUS augmin-like complex subunit 5 isoform X1 n=1 Tax=Physeter macrocephalus TaxID=9755 RepID=A0A455ADV7_PHYMC|nr:HAUS augmin-like complex subunit 5 isoform X1 [Physeter catodon]|eukprot:XP_028333908.1 HAUS augmin-like complex subunit 5 isoform X1 [Physeter catodon]